MQIIDFIDNHQFKPEEIRKSIEHLSWKKQMKCVIESV